MEILNGRRDKKNKKTKNCSARFLNTRILRLKTCKRSILDKNQQYIGFNRWSHHIVQQLKALIFKMIFQCVVDHSSCSLISTLWAPAWDIDDAAHESFSIVWHSRPTMITTKSKVRLVVSLCSFREHPFTPKVAPASKRLHSVLPCRSQPASGMLQSECCC